MKIKILTLFPEMFHAITGSSILGKAVEKGILNIEIINIRDFSKDKHHKADDTPYGGGLGMVLFAQPIFDAMNSLQAKGKKCIYMSPRGRILNHEKILKLSQEEEVVILCGHYEGVDQRVIDYWDMEEISIGDYILTGGELAAMVLVDSVSRFIPQVLGTAESAMEESIYSGLLEYDQYTKPQVYEGMEVPSVLCNGNHKLIHLWQYENSLRLTKSQRPDLFQIYVEKEKELTKDEEKILLRIVEETQER